MKGIHNISIKRKTESLTVMIIQEKINQLQHHYMPMDLNSTYYQSKVNARKKLDYILKHASRRNLQDADFEELLLCALTLVYYFGMRLKLSRLTSRYWYWCGKRQFSKAESAFQKTMDYLQPECSETTIKITFEFFSRVALWPFESFVEQILHVVLYYNRGTTVLFHLLLTDTHCTLFSDVKAARHRMRVLYELLNSANWVIDKQKLLPFVARLLDFFAYSIVKGDNTITEYGYLRKGFEVCLRRIFERVENQHRLMIITTMLDWFSVVNASEDDVLEFSSLLDRAAELYKVGEYCGSFREGIFDHVLSNLIGSPNTLYSLIGCRLMQRFLDRQCNAHQLTQPRIYYEFSQVRLKLGHYDMSDKAFFRSHRENLHEYLLGAIKQHCSSVENLKAMFCIICLIVLEIPCGLTAATSACLVMAIQDFALNGENISVSCRYWMHAMVISVMSLVCWVHRSPVLYGYVNQIISRRAKEAPQLNPPLMQYYNIARHHVTWNKPTLFFEDWELRYGLWKHFKDNKVASALSLLLVLITLLTY